jgi:hypothetical protein
MGRDSAILWGPELGFTENTPPSLSSTQDLGATRRFRCFFGPRGIFFTSATKSESGYVFLLPACKFMMLAIVLQDNFK